MAVYEQTYKPYEGKMTPAWSRFLILPRYAYQDLFKYKLFAALFVLCYVCPLIYTVLIYLRHNLGALAAFGTDAFRVAEDIPIGGEFFFIFINIQTSLAFIFTVIIGPVLISRDICQQRFAALSVPPVFALRVHRRQDVGAADTAFADHMGSGAAAIPIQFLFGRRRLDV